MASKQYTQQDELQMRRQARAAKRRKAEQERRMLLLRLAAVVVIVILVAMLIVTVTRQSPEETTPSETTTEPIQSTQTEPEDTAGALLDETTVIHVLAAGDLNVTDHVVESAWTEGGYDFSKTFLDVAPLFSSADLSILNFEGNLSGPDYGTQTGSAPLALAQALKDMGVDVVQTANSAAIRNGVLGLQSTLDALDQVGITPLGTYRDSAAFRKSGGYTIVEVQGIRIALVAFTKGMDNLSLPEGNDNCVNLLYEDYATDYKEVDTNGINSILKRIAEEQPDLTIAMLHWGSEYNEEVSDTQKTIRNLMLEGGVDVIIGTHSHLLKTIDYNQEDKTLVAYSLGDFFGDGAMAGTSYSVMLDLEITRDNLTGETSVTGYQCIPIYTLQEEDSVPGGHRVVRIQEAMSRYNSGYVGSITAGTYSSMEYALTRIEKRLAQPVK